jgi:hypothetical protein
MSPDLNTLLVLRNARLRAWHTYGVPIAGGWAVEPDGEPRLWLRCTTCGWEALGIISLGKLSGGLSRGEVLETEEAGVLRRGAVRVGGILRVAERSPCEHLAPLLFTDPPEVRALTRLELLAGEPPR